MFVPRWFTEPPRHEHGHLVPPGPDKVYRWSGSIGLDP